MNACGRTPKWFNQTGRHFRPCAGIFPDAFGVIWAVEIVVVGTIEIVDADVAVATANEAPWSDTGAMDGAGAIDGAGAMGCMPGGAGSAGKPGIALNGFKYTQGRQVEHECLIPTNYKTI